MPRSALSPAPMAESLLSGGLYGDILADEQAEQAAHQQQQARKRKQDELDDDASSSGGGLGAAAALGGAGSFGRACYYCAVCAETVATTRQEHERTTAHRFSLFEGDSHPDKATQAAAEPSAVRARAAQADAATERQREAEHQKVQRQSKGFKMLKAAGWKEGEGLGVRGDGVVLPVPTRLVKGRPGLERHLAQPARITHKVALPRSIRAANKAAAAAAGGETAPLPGTRGERRAAKNQAEADAKRHEARMREALFLGGADHNPDGNTGPLWRNQG